MSKKFLFGFFCLSTILLGKTEFTGEKYLGKDIITNLDVNDLEPQKTYEFYFQNVENQLGNPWFIPITVIKGENGNEKFLLNSGVHGNELNSILASYKIKEYLSDKKINGTIIIVHGMNIPGLLNDTRGFNYFGNNENTIDLNRQMDSGKQNSSDEKYSTNLWNHILSKNATKVIDLHTNGKGTSFPLFAYADFRNKDIKKMAELLDADVVKLDNGEPGSVETSFVNIGIPSITFELGSSETVQPEIVNRAVQGIINNLIYWKLLPNKEIKTLNKTFYGNNWIKIKAEKGGFIEPHIKLLNKVSKGDLLFTQYDSFGKKIKEYFSPISGIVVSIKNYPYSTPGDSLGRIIEYNPNDPDQSLK